MKKKMKENLRLLSVCAGLLALASCSTDDFGNLGNNADLSNKIVLKVTNGDAQVTRAYTDAGFEDLTFTGDDVMRIYDSNMRAYDDFKYSPENRFFVLDEDEVRVGKNAEGKMDYTYALFGAADADENNISYAGWIDKKNIALLKIKNEFTYSEVSPEENGVYIYKTNIPMFGNVKNTTEAVTPDAKSFETTVYPLTAYVRVTFENGHGRSVKAVRVRSVKVKDGSADDFNALFTGEKALQKGDKIEVGEDNPTYENFLEPDKMLTGWFEAVLDPTISTTTGEGLQRISEANESVVNNADASNVITMSVENDGMKDSYTNIVYLPIVPDTYELILIEYQDASDNWHYIAKTANNENLKVRGKYVGTTIAQSITVENVTIPGKDREGYNGLESVIEKYAKLDKAMEINVTGDITVYDGNHIADFYTLNVPALTQPITLNIKGKIQNETGKQNTLKIVGQGAGQLIINYENEEAVAPSIAISGKSNITLQSSATSAGYAGTVTVDTEGALTLDGKFAGEVTIENVNDLTLNGEFEKAIEIETEGKVALTGTGTNGFKEAVTVTKASTAALAGTFTGDVTLSGVTGDITLGGTYNGEVEIGTTDDAAGKVTLSGTTNDALTVYATTFEEVTGAAIKGASIANIYATTATLGASVGASMYVWNATTLNVTGSAGYLGNRGTANTTVNITGTVNRMVMMSAGTVNVKDGGKVVASLNLSKNSGATANTVTANIESENFNTEVNVEAGVTATINQSAGSVTTLTNNGTATITLKGTIGTLTNNETATVTTSGAATIGTVTNGDGKKTTINAIWDAETTTAATTATATTANNGNIYTALQLAALSKATATTVNLYADVKASEGGSIEWTPLTVSSGAYTFNGNGHSISNLTVDATAGSKGFFGTVKGTSFDVNNLTLGISVSSTAGYIGGLVGNAQSTTTNITGVTVNAAKVEGTEFVGGLIGHAKGNTVNIKSSAVSVTTLKGTYSVGGLIGVLNAATVNVGKAESADAKDNSVAVTTFTLNGTPSVANAGKFGMLVGSVFNAESKFTASNVTFTNSLTQDVKNTLQFYKNTKTLGSTTKSFTGSTNNEIGYSPNAVKGNVVIGGVTFEVESTIANTADKNINWFDGPLESEINK